MIELGVKQAVFLTFDENYSLHARACLNSLRANYPDYPALLIYYSGDDPNTLNFLSGFARLILIKELAISPHLSQFHLGIVGHPAPYYKYHTWSPQLVDFEKILYLDTDTIVLKSLSPLFERDEFFAVSNHEPHSSVRVFYRHCLDDPMLLRLLKRDRLTLLNDMDDMCNVGVLVVPRRYRTDQQFDLLCTLAKEYGPFLQFGDQSAISIWCKVNGIEFSDQFQYNYQSALFCQTNTKKSIQDINILHFSGKKPNTVDFMIDPKMESPVRKQLARLYQEYAQGVH